MTDHRDHERLQRLLVRHEGLKLKPYYCSAGKVTIGIGRNLEDVGITEAEAYGLLNNDLARCYREAFANFPWFGELDNVRQDVIISMLFNLGVSRLKEFTQMLDAMKRVDFERAASEMLRSKWSVQVKTRAQELSEMMRTGQYPPG